MTEETMVVVQSKVKDFIKSKEGQSSGDLVDALNKKVMGLLADAVARAKANGRTTVRPQDL